MFRVALFNGAPMPLLGGLCIAMGVVGLVLWFARRGKGPDGVDRMAALFGGAIPAPAAFGALIVLGGVVLVMTMGGCAGGGSSAAEAPAAETPAAETPATTGEVEEPKTSEAPGAETPSAALDDGLSRELSEGTASYDMTDTYLDVYTGEDGVTYADAIVEITNTGTASLSLNDASFELLNESGSAIASEDLVFNAPNIVHPGEKGYFYITSPMELPGGYFPGYDYKLRSTLDISAALVGAHEFPVSDVQLSENSDGLKAVATVTNDSDDDESITLFAMFYDNDGRIMGVGHNLMKDVPAGASVTGNIDPRDLPIGCSLAIISSKTFVAQDTGAF